MMEDVWQKFDAPTMFVKDKGDRKDMIYAGQMADGKFHEYQNLAIPSFVIWTSSRCFLLLFRYFKEL